MTIPTPNEFETVPAVVGAEPDILQFPLSLILREAPATVQYRAIIDVAGFDELRESARSLAIGFPAALGLAMAQGGDGSWGDAILTIPDPEVGGFKGVGTVPAFRRLLEYGWDRESPPLMRARRVLFRLLAEDNDRDQLYEFAKEAGDDPDLIHRSRSILREAAAAALAQAGYEGDPRLRGAARRILARVDDYLASPLAAKPWIRVGNRLVLSPDACPPSIHVIAMVAHMPLFRSENHEPISRLLAHISQPAPRQDTCQLLGKSVVPQPHLVMGDPLGTRQAAEADVPFAMTWLELVARLQYLRRHDAWMQVFDRFVADRDRELVWRQRRSGGRPREANPESWPAFTLGAEGSESDRNWDVTLRIGIIARLLGRTIEFA